MEPARWDRGTAVLTLEQEAALLRIVNSVHLHDEAVPDNDRVLAGMFRTDTKRAKRLKAELLAAGKIKVEDGKIVNAKAEDDLTYREYLSEIRSTIGRHGGNVSAMSRKQKADIVKSAAANLLKTLEPGQANGSEQTNPNRIEENRRENNTGSVKGSLTAPHEASLQSSRHRPAIPIDDDTLDALKTAAGAKLGASPGLFVTGHITHLIASGEVTLEDDVLPVLREKASRETIPNGSINSWKFYVPDIRAHAAKRKAQNASNGAGQILTVEQITGGK